jgi:hypothetical protein
MYGGSFYYLGAMLAGMELLGSICISLTRHTPQPLLWVLMLLVLYSKKERQVIYTFKFPCNTFKFPCKQVLFLGPFLSSGSTFSMT